MNKIAEIKEFLRDYKIIYNKIFKEIMRGVKNSSK